MHEVQHGQHYCFIYVNCSIHPYFIPTSLYMLQLNVYVSPISPNVRNLIMLIERYNLWIMVYLYPDNIHFKTRGQLEITLSYIDYSYCKQKDCWTVILDKHKLL